MNSTAAVASIGSTTTQYNVGEKPAVRLYIYYIIAMQVL